MPKHLATRLVSLTSAYEVELGRAGIKAIPGYSLRVTDAMRIIADLEQLRPRVVADLGCGFSTVLFRWWAANAGHPCTVISTDHNGAWITVLNTILDRLKLNQHGAVHGFNRFVTKLRQPLDAILLDNGPTMGDRVKTVASVVAPLLAARGIVWVDDFRGKYRTNVTAALRKQRFYVQPPLGDGRMARAWRLKR